MYSEQFTPAFGVGAVVLARRHLAGVLGLYFARTTIYFEAAWIQSFRAVEVWEEKSHDLFILCVQAVPGIPGEWLRWST